MKNSFTKLLILLFVASALTLGEWALQVVPPYLPFQNIVQADNDDDKDKDKDKDHDGQDDCRVDNSVFGICAHKGFVTVIGMTNKVYAHSTTGSLWAEITSDDVRMESTSGDIYPRGLTQKGTFKNQTGHTKIHYCKTPLDVSGKGLQINSSSTGDVDILFPDDVQFKNSVTSNPALTSIRLTPCSSCSFKLTGTVTGHFFVYGFPMPSGQTNTCEY